MSTFATGDPVAVNLEQFIDRLHDGLTPPQIENDWVDAKEEPGRRAGRTVQPGSATNEQAAQLIAEAAACFANTLTGGAVLVGIADDGTAIGTELDPVWLRSRIGELTDNGMFPYVVERTVLDVRCLAVLAHPSPVPIKVGGRVRMRVDDNCKPVPEGHWFQTRAAIGQYDWSSQASATSAEDVSPTALEAARRFLQESGEPAAADLAESRDGELLRRLDVVTVDGWLSNAGSVLFTRTDRPVLDYIYRDRAGQPSRLRIERGDVGAIEQFTEVMSAVRLALPSAQVLDPSGAAVGTFPALPNRARREAVVNAIAHRDWIDAAPVTIELTGTALVVNSPGRFVGGVTPTNIITHPSVRRSPHLTEVLAKLRLAERQAVGVDTMFLEMLRDGHAAPVIEETATGVRVVLAGGDPDQEWVNALRRLEPPTLLGDLDATLIIDHIARTGYATTSSAATVLQRSSPEAALALSNLRKARIDGRPVIVAVDGDRERDTPAYQLPDPATYGPRSRSNDPDDRAHLLLMYAREKGRITSREAMALTRVTRPTALSDLDALVRDEQLVPAGSGPRAHFVPAK
ncbi:ATP-binding protein [soil metagenome]